MKSIVFAFVGLVLFSCCNSEKQNKISTNSSANDTINTKYEKVEKPVQKDSSIKFINDDLYKVSLEVSDIPNSYTLHEIDYTDHHKDLDYIPNKQVKLIIYKQDSISFSAVFTKNSFKDLINDTTFNRLSLLMGADIAGLNSKGNLEVKIYFCMPDSDSCLLIVLEVDKGFKINQKIDESYGI